MHIAQIKLQVQELIDKDKIILKLYSYLLSKHNDFCTCNYCAILKKYVRAKKLLGFYKREDDYVLELRYQVSEQILKDKIATLKKQKDKLKLDIISQL